MSIIIITNIVFWFALTIFGAAAITSFVPKKIYVSTNFIFRQRSFERNIYKTIKIKMWKDKLPIYRYNDREFDRKHLSKDITREYLEAFILETCKAEFVHLAICILGFSSILFVVFGIEPFLVFALIFSVMLFLHTPFILIQRYNRQRLLKLLYHTYSIF